MVELMLHTGMRPAEVCAMTLNTIDRSGDTWTYRPAHYKTAHHGKGRVVPLGPNGRAVLVAFLAGQVIEHDAPISSPAAARQERFAEMRKNRRSKIPPSQQNRRKANPKKLPTDRYHPHAVAYAIRVACEKAFPLPGTLAKGEHESRAKWWSRLSVEQKGQVKAWRAAHHWHPYQLRHAYATRVRREHGLEAAQVLLGHARADVTQVYAQRNEQLAVTIAAKIG